MNAISKAVDLLGLAVIGNLYSPRISPQAVHKWTISGAVPAERVLAIEAATKGKVSRYDLRPDVFGSPPEPNCATRDCGNHPVREAA